MSYILEALRKSQKEREMTQAAAMAQAAKNAGCTHVIWSTLEDTRKLVPLKDTRLPTIMEKYKVPHFDGKGASNDAFRQIGLPTTYLLDPTGKPAAVQVGQVTEEMIGAFMAKYDSDNAR